MNCLSMPILRFVRVGLRVLSLGILAVGLASGQEPRGEEILRKVFEAYEARQEKMNPIWFRFQFTRYESPAYHKAVGQKGNSAASQYTAEGEFARKGIKTRSWAHYPQSEQGPYPGRENFFIYNGEVQIWPSNRDNEFMISKHPDGSEAIMSPRTMTGEKSFHGALRSWASGKTRIERISVTESKSVSGERTLLLDILFDTKWRFNGSVLPEQDFFLVRGESFNHKGRLVHKFETLEVETVHGLTFPKRGRNTQFIDGAVGAVSEFEITSIETQADRIPDSLFQFDIPKGASVWDNDLKVFVRNTELAQSHLDEVIRRAGTSTWLWRNWLWLTGGAAAFVLIGTAGLVYRRKKCVAGRQN